MSIESKILTLHPESKKGVNISLKRYNTVKDAIMDCLEKKELTHTGLTKCVTEKICGTFTGSVSWYVEVVKLDLEAREIIERITDKKPQLYRI